MNRPDASSLRSLSLAFALAWIVACGLADAPKPAEGQPISLTNPDWVVREDFSGAGPAWEIVDGTWSRRTDPDGEAVFAQTATDRDFPAALLPGPIVTDLDVEVRLRPLSGRVDASGGIVFRARDGRNYYLVRVNSLEGNFRLYRIANGKRSQIASSRIEAPTLGQWHSLRVVAVGEQIQAYLDGDLLIDHRDGTFTSGRVGLWTKADAVTDFDDLNLSAVSVSVPLDVEAIGHVGGS